MTTAEMIAMEGRAEGRAEGKAELVLRLLTRRFGPLAQHASARVTAATSDELDLFAERLFTATTVEEVLS